MRSRTEKLARLKTVSLLSTRTAALLAATLAAGCGGSVSSQSSDGDGMKAPPNTNEPVDASRPPRDDASAGRVANKDAGVAAKSADAAVDSSLEVPDADHGAPSATYPAFPVDVASVVDNGGPVLAAPEIITITWSTDTDAPTWNTFGDSVGPSSYWSAINQEYGVGVATSGAANHISMTTAAPTTFADTDLDTLVSAHAGKDWPASTANTIYALYLPPGTGLTLGGQDACAEGVGGYHAETQDSNHYVYAIMPHCSFFQTADIELSASHEFNEAATDPHPDTNTAYEGFDQNHLAFEFFNQFQDELGDACESFVEATDALDFTPYTVQRQWSNKSAAAGSHWCVPALGEPFYNTTFLAATPRDNISVDLSIFMAGTIQSQGFKVPLHTSRTFAIGYFSDVDTNGPFTLDIQGLDQPITQDENGNNINNGTATVTIDRTSGVNGDIAYVTVTPTDYSTLGAIFFYIRAVLPSATQHHYLPVLITQN
jgi:hypothetical protein